MEKNTEKIIESVQNGINEFLRKWKPNHFYFIHEADIQAQLYYLIYSKLEGNDVLKLEDCFLYPESKRKNDTRKDNKPVITSILHSEQYIGKRMHVDLAIWDPDNDNKKHKYSQKKLLLAIEIKFIRKFDNARKKLLEDIEKMDKALENTVQRLQYAICLSFTFDEIVEQTNHKKVNEIIIVKGNQGYLITPENCLKLK
jgi:hypothetical protein